MRTSKCLIAKLLCAAAIALIASAASAQKAKDTLRVAYRAPISTVDVNIEPQPETIVSSSLVFDFLILFDPESQSYRPGLAESWKQVDPLTLEFKLRQGVKFHDGSDLTADDVVYTFNYLTDPKSKLRYSTTYEWLARTVKIDKYTVRMIAKRPTPYALARLSNGGAILPAAVHGKLADKTEFGRKNPVGTGPYKVEYVDSSRGISFVKNDLFKSPGPWRPAASISRIHILPMPDMQTQIAQLMTGGVELILAASKDEADQLAKTPNLV